MSVSSHDGPGGNDAIALDAQYNLRGHPDRDRVYADYAKRSAVWRDESNSDLDIAYAGHPLARLDVFHATEPRGVVVFFHGGYWRALDRRLFSFLARPFLEQGFSVVMPDYPLAPADRLSTIVEHAHLAMSWVGENVARVNDKTLPVIVSGHSAGGHLAALCAHRTPPSDDITESVIPVVSIAISGLFDLAPLASTNVNEQLQLTDTDVQRFSPRRRPDVPSAASLVIVGGAETEGFRWQSTDYANHLRDLGATAEFYSAPALNHFTILDALASRTHLLHARVMESVERHLKAVE